MSRLERFKLQPFSTRLQTTIKYTLYTCTDPKVAQYCIYRWPFSMWLSPPSFNDVAYQKDYTLFLYQFWS